MQTINHESKNDAEITKFDKITDIRQDISPTTQKKTQSLPSSARENQKIDKNNHAQTRKHTHVTQLSLAVALFRIGVLITAITNLTLLALSIAFHNEQQTYLLATIAYRAIAILLYSSILTATYIFNPKNTKNIHTIIMLYLTLNILENVCTIISENTSYFKDNSNQSRMPRHCNKKSSLNTSSLLKTASRTPESE